MSDAMKLLDASDGTLWALAGTRIPGTDAAALLIGGDVPTGTAQTAGNASLTSVDTKLPATPSGDIAALPVNAQNVDSSLQDTFDYYPNALWTTQSQGTNDIIAADGNIGAYTYLVVSKDPFATGTETSIQSNGSYLMPFEIGIGAHTSQAVVGQEFYVEAVTDATTSLPADVAIASISQAATTLTVTTATAHGLSPGMRIGIYGVNDSRMNYAACFVASVTSPTQFTVTYTVGGAITSLTAGPFTTGYVQYRPAIGTSADGLSVAFDNATVTQAAVYSRAGGGDVRPVTAPKSFLTSNHATTIATRASSPAVASIRNGYCFYAANEFRLNMEPRRVELFDTPNDSSSYGLSNRATTTSLIPDPAQRYRFRVRAVNTKGLTVPVAKIVNVSKSGTTTATVTTDVAHGLTTADYINAYGVRDQTNFANLTTATVVASVVDSTTFTVVWGAAVTASARGGYISRINGAINQQGAVAQVAQSVSVATGSGRLTVVGNATWATVVIGDYVNVVGMYDTSGNLLGYDGPWRVFNLSGTTLELEPIGSTTAPADLASVNCGGGVIKRSDIRLSYVRMHAAKRLRVEQTPKPASAVAESSPVTVANTPAVTLGFPGAIPDLTSTAISTTATSSTFTPYYGPSYEVNIPVTVVSGTTPTMDVVVQESDDSGTNWYDVYHFPRITVTGMYRSPKIPLTGNRVRYVQTIGGTTPSFTRAINRVQTPDSVSPIRQLIDRAISLTTLNATTAGLNIQNCRSVQLVLNLGAATTPPAIQLEGSDDGGTTYYALGSPLTGTASATVQTTVNNVQAGLLRARVSTAGATVTAGYLLIKGF